VCKVFLNVCFLVLVAASAVEVVGTGNYIALAKVVVVNVIRKKQLLEKVVFFVNFIYNDWSLV
jgi:hypothetical protein